MSGSLKRHHCQCSGVIVWRAKQYGSHSLLGISCKLHGLNWWTRNGHESFHRNDWHESIGGNNMSHGRRCWMMVEGLWWRMRCVIGWVTMTLFQRRAPVLDKGHLSNNLRVSVIFEPTVGFVLNIAWYSNMQYPKASTSSDEAKTNHKLLPQLVSKYTIILVKKVPLNENSNAQCKKGTPFDNSQYSRY